MPEKRRNGERGPDKKPRKGSPRRGKPGSTRGDESPSRARKAKALDLLCEGKPVADVAKELGVTKHAVYKWLDNEAFAAELDARLAGARARAKRILEASAEEVASSLVKVAKDGEIIHGPRVAAARDILDRIGLAPTKEVKVDVTGDVGLAAKSDDELLRIAEGKDRA